jgi:hypothetical protein
LSLRWRRGAVAQGAPPPPSAFYGPTAGRDSVIAGVGPRTVNSPGTGISFNSAGSLQTAINNNPSGSTFVCSTNTPLWNQEVSTGTKAPIIIFPGTPGQCVIDGQGGDFRAVVCGNGTSVTGGEWKNFGTSSAFAHIFLTENDVTIQDVLVHNGFEKGIGINGLNNLISHARVYSCGRYGISTGTTSSDRADGLVIEYTEVHSNNTRNLNGGADAGGTKFAHSNDAHVHHNYIHDNHGFGLWPDTGNLNWVIEENVMEGNHFSGMMYEANAASLIWHNYIANNGDWTAGVGADPSTFENNVNVRLSDDNCNTGVRGQCSNNIIDHNLPQTGQKGGLLLLWDHSGTVARSAQNWDIHDNQFWLRGTVTPRLGGEESGAGLNAFPVWSSGNSFFSNQYRVASIAANLPYWKWDTGNGTGVAQTYSAWQGFHAGETLARIEI